MRVSESPYGLSESYAVKFWYTKPDGFRAQTEEYFYANSKNAHKKIENYAKKNLSKFYSAVDIVSITYI